MIFATCGSSPIPFSRMMEALDTLDADELYAQHGPAAPPRCTDAYDFLPFERMVELIERANVIVSHAGVGSIICALRAGHVPVVFPRLKRYSETVDDHQAELAESLERRGNVMVAWTADQLADAIARVPPRGTAPQPSAELLNAAVGAALRSEPYRRLARSVPAGRRIGPLWPLKRPLHFEMPPAVSPGAAGLVRTDCVGAEPFATPPVGAPAPVRSVAEKR